MTWVIAVLILLGVGLVLETINELLGKVNWRKK